MEDLKWSSLSLPEPSGPPAQLARERIERYAARREVLLDGTVADVQQPINYLSMLTGAEREKVLYEFNDTAVAYPQDRLIHELFEEQAQRTPDAVAVAYEGQSLTYAELNGKANQLARYLRKQGVDSCQLVGICVERSVELVVGLLGILKAGGAYVPLDPNYPGGRLQHMLENAAPQVVLTQEKLKAVLPATQAEVFALDAKWKKIEGYAVENLSAAELGLTAQNLVYVIYTSGSTGLPKGTAMSHRSMVNLIEWHRERFCASEGSRVLQFAALSFDVAFQETFSTLCTGGTLVMLDEWVRRDLRALTELLRIQSIERVFLPPLMLQSLAEYFKTTGAISGCLHDVITAGEQLRVSPEIASFFKRLNGCRLHNHYGPTETHVVTALTLTGDSDEWPVFPSIGQPISNTQIYVLDGQRLPVPIGVSGEIYISGTGLARGYLGRSELTAERFTTDPFSADSQARMYKTGDLGRWRADGTLEYLGRTDDQVKIRGYRVELGEIETQLARHVQVKEAVVVAREDAPGEKRLVAYTTRRDGSDASVEELRAHLKAVLPEYMVPSAFVSLESLPLTPSGKLDRRALPAPKLAAYVSREYEAPQGEVERILAGIWQELLRVERVGRQHNFFELGGDSLLMVQMMERLRRAGLAVEVRRVFESPTLADLASALTSEVVGKFEVPPNLIPIECEEITPQMLPLVALVALEAQHIEWIVQTVPGGAANIQDIYPLAPLQEGILFHHLLNERGGDTYVLPMLLSLSSREKLEEFIAALQEVIDRHDVLRTAVLWDPLPSPVQVVYRQATLLVDAIALDRDRDPIEQLRERMRPEVQRLDLRQAPLMRLQIAADPHGGQWYAVLQLHHLVCDHESLETMLAEVMAYVDGRGHELPNPVPYRSHVAQALAHARTHDAESFFRSKLAEIDEPTAPFGLLDVRGDGSRIAEARQTLESALAQRVRVEARRLSVSPATLFHAAWGLVVARTCGRDDVVFGTLLSGRLQGSAGAQRVLGMFINTLPLRLRLRDITVRELVEQTQRELVELLNHEQASLAVAQRCSDITGSAPLFSTLLNYLHGTPNPESDGIQVLAVQEWSNYPVTLSVDDQNEGFLLTAQTDRRVDPHRILGYICTAIQILIDALETAPQTPVLALSILPERERHQIIESFNTTLAAYPHDKLIHELFEEQVRKAPAAIAAAYKDEHLTYAELNRRANQLAHFLRAQGIGPDRLVGLCVERSLEMVVALLGVLKAGGAYVPLDPAYPPERLAYMLRDAAPTALLIHEQLKNTLPETSARVVALDSEWSTIAEYEQENLVPSALGLSPRHLAYVIYTSGSTGEPKGVMLEHRGLCNLAAMQVRMLGAHADSRILQFASLSFDACTWEWVMALCAGACLCLASREELTPGEPLRSTLHTQGITHVTLPPVALGPVSSSDGLPALSTLVVAGEACSAVLVERWAPGRRFINAYGPTEATVCASLHLCDPHDARSPPIGRPISNARIYILDSHGQPVPPGVAGEICIGGAGVARGYLNRPELTAERFIADAFSPDPQARAYKTGDLGQWGSDGTLEYLGRNDHQVKIRGFRIELGEIEAQLLQHAHVKEAAVLAREDESGEKRLVAYVTQRDQSGLSVEALRAHLKAVLPEHMVPSAFVTLQSLPLTPNGKLDRRALPVPELGAYASQEYEAPQGEVEEVLARIWQELLHVEQVGRQDDFFELGGHSLLATQLTVRIRSSLLIEMPMSVLFEFPTLGELSAQVDELRQARLLDRIAEGGNNMEELLERVGSMPEGKVRELVRKLRMEGRL